MITTKKTADGIRVTKFSIIPLIAFLFCIGLIWITVLDLDENWQLPKSYKMNSSINLSDFQKTVVVLSTQLLFAFCSALMGSYNRIIFNRKTGVAKWKTISIFGIRNRTYPLSSVTDFYIESSQAIGRFTNERYKFEIKLCVDDQYLTFSGGLNNIKAEELAKYHRMIETVRDTIGLTDKNTSLQNDDTSITKKDQKKESLSPRLSLVSPGVYSFSRSFLGILLFLPTSLFFLYLFYSSIPEIWTLITDGGNPNKGLVLFPGVLSMFILTPALILSSLFFAWFGKYHRMIIDTNNNKIRSFNIGLFGWSRRNFYFNDVTEVKVTKTEEESVKGVGVLGQFTQVVLLIQNQKDFKVTFNAYGIAHQRLCEVLASNLRHLLKLDSEHIDNF